jgi:hypothetical protein
VLQALASKYSVELDARFTELLPYLEKGVANDNDAVVLNTLKSMKRLFDFKNKNNNSAHF